MLKIKGDKGFRAILDRDAERRGMSTELLSWTILAHYAKDIGIKEPFKVQKQSLMAPKEASNG